MDKAARVAEIQEEHIHENVTLATSNMINKIWDMLVNQQVEIEELQAKVSGKSEAKIAKEDLVQTQRPRVGQHSETFPVK